MTDDDEDHNTHESTSISSATMSTGVTPYPHEPSPLAATTNTHTGKPTFSSSRSSISISSPHGAAVYSRQSSPRNSIDSRSLLLAAFGGDVRRIRRSQKSQPSTTVEPFHISGGIERFDRPNSSRSIGSTMGSTKSPRFPFRHMASSVKSSTDSPPATARGSGSGPSSTTPGTPTG